MFLFLPLLAVITGVSSQISEEKTVKKFGFKLHVFVRFLLSAIITYFVNVIYKIITIGFSDLSKVFLDFHLVFSLESLFFIALFLVVFVAWIILFNKILEDSAIYLLNILMKISMVFILIIEMFLGNLVFSFEVVLAITLFLFGILFVLNVFTKKKVSLKGDKKTIIIMIILVLTSLTYQYQQQHLLTANYLNKETMLMLSAFCTSFYGLFVLKPNLSKFKQSLKPYFFQAFAYVISRLVLMEIIKTSMTTYMFTLGIMGVGVTIFSSLILKRKISKYQYVGVVLAMAGFIYMQILINS